MSDKDKKKWYHIEWLGALCALAAMFLYSMTMSRGAYPGESAKMIAEYAGLAPSLPLLHPVWWILVQIAGALPFGALALRINFLSALCGSLAVWLMYEIVAGISHNLTTEEQHATFDEGLVSKISGLSAACFLATSAPFWLASTRALNANFNSLLVLFIVRQLQLFRGDGRRSRFYVIALLIGIATGEFPTMLLLVLPLWLALIYIALEKGFCTRRKRIRATLFWRWLATSVAFIVVGLMPALLFALLYRASPAYVWRDFPNFFRLLVHIAGQYYGEFRGNIHQLGWMLVGLVSVVPMLAVLIPKRGQKRDQVRGSLFMHFVLGILAVAIALNFHVSPWVLFGHRVVATTPYLFIAVWVGYLAGYWWAIVSQKPRRFEQNRIARPLRSLFTWALLPSYALIIMVAAAANLPVCDGRNAAPVQSLARDVVESLQGRSWLITDGHIDDMLQIAARERGVDLQLINPRLAGSRPYARYLATLFDNPRLKGLALLGLSPLIQEWFSDHPEYVQKEVAVMSNPDYWLSSGYDFLPNGFLYFGAREADYPVRSLDRNEEDWARYEFSLAQKKAWPAPIQGWNRLAVRHVSKVANNTGFALQHSGHSLEALRAYQAADRMDPTNISALLNLSLLAPRVEADGEVWRSRLADLTSKYRGRLNTWNLSHLYGYVYDPMAFVGRGLTWALSGKPDLGITEIRRALALGGEGERMQILLGGMHFMLREGDLSEDAFLRVLESNPESIEANQGLLRLNVLRGRFDLARGYLLRLEELGLDSRELAVENAALESISGNKEGARRILEDLLRGDPGNARGWTMMALLAVELNDRELQEHSLRQLRRAGTPVPRELLMAMAQVALTLRETSAARMHVDALLKRFPSDETALEWRLRIDVFEFNRDQAERTAERLLAVNPKNGFANFIMGTIHMHREQYALAEPFLQASVAARRTVEHLNTLAYAMYKRERYAAAMPIAVEALEADDRHGPAWNTYAALLRESGELDQALESVVRALDFMPENAEARHNLALIYEAREEYSEALHVLTELLSQPSRYTLSMYDELRESTARVRAKIRGDL